MATTHELLALHPLFAGLDAPSLDRAAACAKVATYEEGDALAHEGDAATCFFAVSTGSVAIQALDADGTPTTLQVAGPGEIVGWSWLTPPHRWVFDARALSTCTVLAIDAACIRRQLEEDPRLAFAVLSRMTAAMGERLRATRLRMVNKPHESLNL